MRYNTTKRDPIKNSFIMPNEIFRLGLSEGTIAVYAYLLYYEDRGTYQCYPSYTDVIPERNFSGVRRHICRLWKMPSQERLHMQKRRKSAIRSRNLLLICRERHPHVVIREVKWNCSFSDNSCRSRWIYPVGCGIVLY